MKTTLLTFKLFLLTVCFGIGLSLNAQTTYTVQNTNDSGAGSLREAINGATDGDIIRFNSSIISSGSATITLASQLDVYTSLTFKGLYNSTDTLYISGDYNSAVFYIETSGKTVLDSMVLVNGYNTQYGGAVSFMNSDDTLWVNNSEIYNSYAQYGGGIYAESDVATIVLNNSKLANNEAYYGGGAIYAYSALTSASITVNNSTIINNVAGYGGGICSETNNSANAYVFVDGSLVENNEAYNDEAGGIETYCYNDGLAIVEVKNSTVKGNYSNNYGGGVYAYSLDNNSSITIDNTIIEGNIADYGGGVYCYSESNTATTTLNDCTIKDNSCNESGGGVYVYSYDNTVSLTLNNCTVEENIADSYGGGIYAEGTNTEVTLTDGSIISNECDSDGGGVYLYGGEDGPTTITVNNVLFSGNYADDEGGAIYADGNHLTVELTSSEINNNSTYNYGGALYFYGDTTLVTIESSEINGNETFNEGGGAITCFAENHIEMNVNESELSSNTSAYKGGAILAESYYADNVILNISNSNLNDNIASEDGGAISSYCYFGKSLVTVTNSTMSGNTSGYDGGAISCQSNQDTSNVVVVNSTLSNNSSSGEGGAIYSRSTNYKSIIDINGSTLFENNASMGGAIVAYTYSDSSLINIKNSTIANNTADNDFDGIFSMGDLKSILTVTSSIISNDDNMYLVNSDGIVSGGYNIFSDAPTGYISVGANQDMVNVSAMDLNLQSLANNGGTTLTAIPGDGSIAIDAGDPSDMTDAQNRPVINGRRDIGAAEYNCTEVAASVNETCDPSFTWMDGVIYTSNNNSAQYKFINSTGGCDIFYTLDLTLKTVNAGVTQTSGVDLVAVAYQADDYQWINCSNNMPVNGAINQTFVPSSNGDYAVIVTDNGCTDTSVCIMVSTVGLDDLTNDFGVNIYPNPANDKVTISLSDFPSNGYALVIYDAVGNVVINQNIVSQTTTIETSQLISGMYFVKISDDKNTTVNRLVIE